MGELYTVEEFKDYVVKNTTDNVINKYLLYGTPYIFKDDIDRYFELKQEISKFFNTQQTQIYMVGSAKLGFSISPLKGFKPFNEDSDIDIAIIDSGLFGKYWKLLLNTGMAKTAKTEKEDKKYKKFLEYLFNGWLRPDLFPYKMKEDWFNFFKTLYGKYNYKVTAGI